MIMEEEKQHNILNGNTQKITGDLPSSTQPIIIEDSIILDTNKLSGHVLGERYQLLEKLGSGAFGVIYKTTDLKNPSADIFYACKLEKSDTKHPQIIFEARLLNYLYSKPSIPSIGFPKCFFFDKQGDYNIMIMELLGNSLEQLFSKCKRLFSLKTVLMLADQMIQRIEYLHSRNFLHRDIKPDNFLMGLGQKRGGVYMIDFGLAKRYSKDDGHIPYKEGKNLTGTARYASYNTQAGVEQSRRDDLESLAYVLIYFLKGELPWQNIRAKDKKEKYAKIKVKKETTTVEELCAGLPQEFNAFLKYTKELKFEEKPNYSFCRKLFKDLMEANGWQNDLVFDWDLINGKDDSRSKINNSSNNNNNKMVNSNAQQKQDILPEMARTRYYMNNNTEPHANNNSNNNINMNGVQQKQQQQQQYLPTRKNYPGEQLQGQVAGSQFYQQSGNSFNTMSVPYQEHGRLGSEQDRHSHLVQGYQQNQQINRESGDGFHSINGSNLMNFQQTQMQQQQQQQQYSQTQPEFMQANQYYNLETNHNRSMKFKSQVNNGIAQPAAAAAVAYSGQPSQLQNQGIPPQQQTSALAKQGNSILTNNSQLHFYQQQHQQHLQQQNQQKQQFSSQNQRLNTKNSASNSTQFQYSHPSIQQQQQSSLFTQFDQLSQPQMVPAGYQSSNLNVNEYSNNRANPNFYADQVQNLQSNYDQ